VKRKPVVVGAREIVAHRQRVQVLAWKMVEQIDQRRVTEQLVPVQIVTCEQRPPAEVGFVCRRQLNHGRQRVALILWNRTVGGGAFCRRTPHAPPSLTEDTCIKLG
jgi:hypothetical protein